MSIFCYQASELYQWLVTRKELVVVDVRNNKDFSRFAIESPYPFEMLNISYYDFMEIEEESVAKIPRDKPIRIVCAKEGSAKYVAEILEKNGFDDVGYLENGIKSWGNMLIPTLVNPGEEYQLYQFVRPGKASCSYGLVYNNEIMFFDPSRNTEFYQDFAKEKGLKITHTFETHLQADYIAGSRVLMETSGAAFMANADDFSKANFSYTAIQDEQKIHFSDGNGPEVKVLFTPGHTPGSTSYEIDNRYLISGDAVFLQSVGRPDLGGQVDAWSDILFATLQKVQQYDQNLIVLPGHYSNWEEADDKLIFAAPLKKAIAHNKEIYDIDNAPDFLAFIKKNMRPQPEEYATIRAINANLEQVDDEKAEELDLGKNECAATTYAQKQGQKES